MNTPQPMNMRDGTVVSEKMEPVVPPLVCRDVKSTKRRFNPSNGSTWTTAGTEIRVPIAGPFVLDNKNVNLNFKLKSSLAAVIDFSPVGLFSQIRVEAGSGSSIILKSIDEPGLWANMLYQYTWTQEDLCIQNGKMHSAIKQPAVDTSIITKSGHTFGANGLANIAIDLSQFMGIFYGTSGIPLYDTNGITLVLTLATPESAMAATVTTVFTIDNLYVSATCLEGGEAYERKLKELKSSGAKEISIMYNTCRRYVQNCGASAQIDTQFLINERSKSCLGFIAISRNSIDTVAPTLYSNSSSLFLAYSRHLYSIGGMQYPVSGIATDSEAIDEAYDIYSHLSRRHNSGGLLARTQASSAGADDAPASSGSQVLAVNLSKCGPNEVYWGKGMNLSGTNLSNYLQVTYTPAKIQTLNIYSVFQMKLHIDAMGNFTTEF